MSGPRISIIVVNWNLPQETLACVHSLSKSSYRNFEVVLVDNASSDNSVGWFNKELSQAVLLTSPVNLGYAGGNNIGIRYALQHQADYILLLNNDTEVHSNLLEKMLWAAQKEPGVGILGPAVYYFDDPNRIWGLGSRHKWWSPIPIDVGRNQVNKGRFKEFLEVDYVTGCAMWIKATVFFQIGFLDESFFMYYEDAEFCHRARRAGNRIGVVPGATVFHKVSQSSRSFRGKALYYQTRNRFIFYNRMAKGPRKAMVNLFLGQKVLRQCIASLSDRSALSLLWHGLRDGLKKKTGEMAASNGEKER